MQIQIIGEKAFRLYGHSFAVSPSAEGYQLAYSADGVNFTNHSKSVPAGETLLVNGAPNETVFKLIGNQSLVKISF